MIRLFLAMAAAVPLLVLLAPAFAVVGALLLFAAVVRRLAALMEPKFVPWHEIMTFDRTLGWKPRPRLDVHYLASGDDVFRAVTDDEGWAGTRSSDECPVVVIGDSFAFGYGVDAGRGFADLNASVRMKGVGAPGYSMVQGVLLMEQLAERLTGKLVVWFVCLENDLQDSVMPGMWRYRGPFVRLSRERGEWEIVGEHVRPTPWQPPDPGWRRIFAHLCVPGPLADRVYSGCDYLTGRAAAACARVGAQLVVMTIPTLTQLTAAGRAELATSSGDPKAFDASFPDRRVAEICERHGVPVIVGMKHLTALDYKQHERIHWNVRGHQRVADLLARVHASFTTGTRERVFSHEPPLSRASEAAVGAAR